MKVQVAEKWGFCFGVERALETAQKAVKEDGCVCSLGPMIHNQQVVERLREQGLDVIDTMDQADGRTVVIRSHGVPPETLARAEELGLKVVDGTCVLVKRAQEIVGKLATEGYQVVMIGDANHPEVRGVIGYAPNVIVVDTDEQIDSLPRRGKLGVVAQTTLRPEHVGEVVAKIIARSFSEVRVINTLCLEVVRRQQSAIELARKVDVMFVLGGLHSANTCELAELCRQQDVPTYHLEGTHQFSNDMIAGHTRAGVTAGASTPEWVVNDFVTMLESL